jgi:hypothetical protein
MKSGEVVRDVECISPSFVENASRLNLFYGAVHVIACGC